MASELAAHVTNLLPGVRVLYMSGYTENAIGRDGMLDAGINLLQKPFSLPALKDRIGEVLDSEPIPREIALPFPSPGSDVLEKTILRKTSHPSALAVSIFAFRCSIVRSGRKTGVRVSPKISAAPACSSRPRKCSIPALNWRLTSCCPRRLPASPRPKSSVAEKWSAPSRPRNRQCSPSWPQKSSNIIFSTEPQPGVSLKLACGETDVLARPVERSSAAL